MSKLHTNLQYLMPETTKKMPLIQLADIQSEVIKLLPHNVKFLPHNVKFLSKMFTKMITGITIKHLPFHTKNEVIEIYKWGKLKTSITFEHDKSGEYGFNTHIFINHPKP